MTDKSFFVSVTHSLATYIEQELGMRRGAHFRFVKVVPSYKVLTLWLTINPTYTKAVLGMTKELSQAARLPKGSFIRAEWGGRGVVELQVPKPSNLWVTPQMARLPRLTGVQTAVGFDTGNKAAWADFANPVTAHGLIAGLSGSGKSNLARVLAYMLAMQNEPEEVQFLLFDVADAGLAWDGFENLPHLMHGVIGDMPTALDAMDWLVGEMDRRAQARETIPHLFAIIDEFQALAKEPRFIKAAENTARRSRKWGGSLILATQRPVKDSMGSMNIKANLGLRVVGKVTSGQEAAWATDLPESGAQDLLEVGDFLLVKPGSVQRIAIPLLGSDDLARLPSNGDMNQVDFTVIQGSDGYDEAEARALVRLTREMQTETGFDALETVIGLLAAYHDKGRPWLKDTLEAEGRGKPGSGRARRLLAWGQEIQRLLGRYRHKLTLTA